MEIMDKPGGSAIIRIFKIKIFLILFCSPGILGCSYLMSSVTQDFADNLSQAILDNNDPETVEAGGAAYLIMIDSLIQGNPQDVALLRTGASLYSAYTGIFVKDDGRIRRLTEKALDYAFRAACLQRQDACSFKSIDFETFTKTINRIKQEDVPVFYTLGASWAGWIQAHKNDFNAVAQLSKIESIMTRIVELEESHQQGGAHLYLGMLATWLPPALGGRPETGRFHFERAIQLSNGQNLMAKVLYAKHYARLMFDQKLHDRLLGEVLEADPKGKGLTLINILAQKQAMQLMEDGRDFF